MNKQEIFTRVATHLLTQNKQAKDAFGLCVYRTDEGLTCAVGCLISKKNYCPEMEGMSVSEMLGALESSIGRVSDSALSMLEDLQACHDQYPPYQWPDELKRIAKAHKVRMSRAA